MEKQIKNTLFSELLSGNFSKKKVELPKNDSNNSFLSKYTLDDIKKQIKESKISTPKKVEKKSISFPKIRENKKVVEKVVEAIVENKEVITPSQPNKPYSEQQKEKIIENFKKNMNFFSPKKPTSKNELGNI